MKTSSIVLIGLCVICIGIVAVFAYQKSATSNPMDAQPKKVGKVNRWYSQFPGRLSSKELENRSAVIKTAKGEIAITFFGEEAPLAVSNFITLASDQYYDGLTFHRREEGFVIQGGDPNGNGTGGPGYSFADEPVTRSYTRGIVAMANAGPNTNGSQFFIMLGNVSLPPSYTIFGEVTSGMEVVDAIQVGDVMTSVRIK